MRDHRAGHPGSAAAGSSAVARRLAPRQCQAPAAHAGVERSCISPMRSSARLRPSEVWQASYTVESSAEELGTELVPAAARRAAGWWLQHFRINQPEQS
jgi:hypothetical protein